MSVSTSLLELRSNDVSVTQASRVSGGRPCGSSVQEKARWLARSRAERSLPGLKARPILCYASQIEFSRAIHWRNTTLMHVGTTMSSHDFKTNQLETNRRNAIEFYRMAYLGRPADAVRQFVGDRTARPTCLLKWNTLFTFSPTTQMAAKLKSMM